VKKLWEDLTLYWMKETDLERLRDTFATAKLLVERGWCQRTYAQDSSGTGVSPTSPNAVCWCVTGAVDCAARTTGGGGPIVHGAFFVVFMEVMRTTIGPATWNDHPQRTKKEVVEMFQRVLDTVTARLKSLTCPAT
jgi:hypothetical protein